MMDNEEYSEALELIDESIRIIKDFNQKWGIKDSRDSTREIRILTDWRDTVLNKKPLSKLERLQEELDEAVRMEKYEEAARIRDKLEKLHEKE
jgi:excinuclease UvrABC helicase subunit UvrB